MLAVGTASGGRGSPKRVAIRPEPGQATGVRREHLRAAIQGVAAQLGASLKASSPIGDALTKGELREEDLVRAFRPHVPLRYEMVKGVVVNAAGEESDPQDLLLLDTHVLPSIAGASNTRYVPIEGVAGTVQVKSRATREEIARGVANVASAKRLLPQVPRVGITPGQVRAGFQTTTATCFGGLIFLASDRSDEHLRDVYVEEVLKLPPRERCDAFCVLDRFSVLWGNPSTGTGLHFCFRGEQAETPMVIEAGDDSLLFFYLSLVEHLRNWITPNFDWLDYVFGPTPRATTGMNFQYSYYYDDDHPPEWLGQDQGPAES